MPRSITEKFQVIGPAPLNENEDYESWVSFESARVPFPQDYLQLPPELIQEPALMQMPLLVAGQTDVTNASETPTLRAGYLKHDMVAADDMYTMEHQDLFYGDAGGFVERNNYLDRN